MYLGVTASLVSALALITPTPSPTHAATPAPGLDLSFGTILTILVGPAVIAAVITLLAQWPASSLRRNEAATAAYRDLSTRALSEFYGPIRERLDEVKILQHEIRVILAAPEDPEWHSLDHINEIKRDKIAWALFGAIMTVNSSIKDILDEKSGLALGSVTESGRWRVHQALLQRSYENPRYAARGIKLSYFPKKFEEQISAGFVSIAAEVGNQKGARRGGVGAK